MEFYGPPGGGVSGPAAGAGVLCGAGAGVRAVRRCPNAKQEQYIRRLVAGVADHAAELDDYIARYAQGWRFERIPLMASAVMRVAMYEILYMPDIPHGVAISEAVQIAGKYESAEVVKFINGILASFLREEVKD